MGKTKTKKAENLQAQIVPVGDRVLAQVVKEDSTLPSGIVIPDSAIQQTQKARVLAVGPGTRKDDGEYNELPVSPGDLVLHARYSGQEIKLEGEEFLILSGADIIARIVEDD